MDEYETERVEEVQRKREYVSFLLTFARLKEDDVKESLASRNLGKADRHQRSADELRQKAQALMELMEREDDPPSPAKCERPIEYARRGWTTSKTPK